MTNKQLLILLVLMLVTASIGFFFGGWPIAGSFALLSLLGYHTGRTIREMRDMIEERNNNEE